MGNRGREITTWFCQGLGMARLTEHGLQQPSVAFITRLKTQRANLLVSSPYNCWSQLWLGDNLSEWREQRTVTVVATTAMWPANCKEIQYHIEVSIANLSFSTSYHLPKLLNIFSSGTISAGLTARNCLPTGHISTSLQQQNFLVMKKRLHEIFPRKAEESAPLKFLKSRLKVAEGRCPRLW